MAFPSLFSGPRGILSGNKYFKKIFKRPGFADSATTSVTVDQCVWRCSSNTGKEATNALQITRVTRRTFELELLPIYLLNGKAFALLRLCNRQGELSIIAKDDFESLNNGQYIFICPYRSPTVAHVVEEVGDLDSTVVCKGLPKSSGVLSWTRYHFVNLVLCLKFELTRLLLTIIKLLAGYQYLTNICGNFEYYVFKC